MIIWELECNVHFNYRPQTSSSHFLLLPAFYLTKNERKTGLLVVPDLEARDTFTFETLHERPAARVSKQGKS